MTPPTRCTSPRPASKSVAVIDTATCNATDVSGCAAHHASIPVGGEYPNAPLLDEDTGSLYVSYGAKADKVAVAGTGACNAEVTSGCGAPRGNDRRPSGHLQPGPRRRYRHGLRGRPRPLTLRQPSRRDKRGRPA